MTDLDMMPVDRPAAQNAIDPALKTPLTLH
jgi:hypothetical protein